MLRVNLPLEKMGALLNHERRVAVPFYRDERKVACLQFEPVGPVLRELPLDVFDRNYKIRVDLPLETVALKFIGACRTCYLPGSRVVPTLMEIFNMTQTNGTADLSSLSQSELTETYNKLATAASKGTVKSFKDKATAIARIQALQGEVGTLTPSQQKAADAADAKAAAPAAKKAAAKKEPAAKPEAKPKNLGQHIAAKKAAKAPAQKSGKAADGEKKPRGMGVGKFCMDLILKGKTNEEVLEAVKAKFPEAATSASSVSWYRNKLKSEGQLEA
jgi:hypothetical protein